MWELWKTVKTKKPGNDELLEEYVRNEVKFRQMSLMYWVSKRTVWKRLHAIDFSRQYCDSVTPWPIVLLMDATYFGRAYGYIIFRARYPETKTGKNLLRYKVCRETNDKYREWRQFLIKKWWTIQAIVCDWRQWLLGWFWSTPTQLCIHHMKQIIVRLLTKKPKLEQTQSLKVIADCIWIHPEDDIRLALTVRYDDNLTRLKEKNEKERYSHERARKAYKSIKNKIRRCYTFEQYPELNIPKTNNSLESINSHLKSKTRIHRWMKESFKDTFINYYLYKS